MYLSAIKNSRSILVLLLVLLFSIAVIAQENKQPVSITILYDNYDLVDSELEEDWGFAALIRGFDEVVLFDSGTKPDLMMGNLEKAGIDPKEVGVVIISHLHHDHIGGLQAFLQMNHDVKVYIPASFPDEVRKQITASGAQYVDVKGKREILPGLYSTGEMGSGLIEQSVFFSPERGAGILTGCAHPGIENIVEKVHSFTGKKVGVVIGGFHLMSASGSRLESIVETFEKTGVTRLLPTHCTGDPARSYFKKHYGEKFIRKGLSETIVLK